MRKIAANYIITNVTPPLKNGVIVVDDNGVVQQVIDTQGNLKETEAVEFYNGVLVPGFVNAHCHLELSHMHHKVEEKTGITEFVRQINENRIDDEEAIMLAAQKQDRLMFQNGIVAVGDIANTSSTISTKLKSKIHYHTFVEVFGFSPKKAVFALKNGLKVVGEYERNGLKASLVPHSPYSVSEQLFKLIKDYSNQNRSILSIHNQESKAENEMYEQGKGIMLEHILRNIKADVAHWKGTGKSSLQSVLSHFPTDVHLLLVHNVFTNLQDIAFLKQQRDMSKTYFVLCPQSNLYIENQLPPIDIFKQENLTICIGTDSLASNHFLSMIYEMQAIQQQFPDITLPTMIQWATLNGAKALSIDNQYGSFEVGKKPGINLLTDVDLNTLKLTPTSSVKPIF
ncbi:MAG: amidohydrolase [Draconibacterium sp.]|nr:MAG: amidohydrolase [Draconibacterium sp.]